MPNEEERKRIALSYCHRVSTGEVDSLIELFAPEATVEDPVGGEPAIGRDAVRKFYQNAVDQVQPVIEPGVARASHDGTSVVVPITVQGKINGRLGVISAVDVFEIDEAGRIASMRSYWGPSDVS